MDDWLWALGLNGTLALVAFLARTVSLSGVVGGLVVGSALYLLVGLAGWLVLVAFFALGSAASKLGYGRKAAMGAAQEAGGRRGARHALANCGAALAFAILFAIFDHPAYLFGYIGAFATALADTVASEIGMLYGRTPILITTLRRVEPGTDGAVSLEGTLAGLVAALALAALGWGLGLVDASVGAAQLLWIAVLAALVGTTFESFVGATLEGIRGVDNEVVNFLNTAVGGGTAALLAVALI